MLFTARYIGTTVRATPDLVRQISILWTPGTVQIVSDTVAATLRGDPDFILIRRPDPPRGGG